MVSPGPDYRAVRVHPEPLSQRSRGRLPGPRALPQNMALANSKVPKHKFGEEHFLDVEHRKS